MVVFVMLARVLKPFGLLVPFLGFVTNLGIAFAQEDLQSADGAEQKAQNQGADRPLTLAKPPALLEGRDAVLPGETKFPQPEMVVELKLEIDSLGEVTEIRVVKSAGVVFDTAAKEAVSFFKFTPAILSNGESTAITIFYRMVITEPPPPPPPPVQLKVRLLERGTRKPLGNVPVVLKLGPDVLFEAMTGNDGWVELRGLPGSPLLLARPIAHESLEETLELRADEVLELVFYLQETSNAFRSYIRGRRVKREVTKRVIPREQILLIAGTQGDTLKVIENLPGTNRTQFSGGDLVLRGANPGDSLVLLEGHEIPLIYHFGGLRSAFNSAFVDSLNFVPSNFGSEFGRATGGVVEVKVRDLDSEVFRGNIDFNLYDAGFALEGPLKDDWTMGGAFHRSYIDTILPAVFPEDAAISFNTAPRYYDYQFIAAKKFNQYDQARFMFFGSLDRLKFLFKDPGDDPAVRGDLTARTMFHKIQASYRSRYTSGIEQNTSIQSGVTAINFQLGPSFFFNLNVKDIDFRNQITIPILEQLKLRGGLDIRFFHVNISLNSPRPPQEGTNRIPTSTQEKTFLTQRLDSISPGAFIEFAWKPAEGFEIVPSLRFDYYQDIDFIAFDPRFLARWRITEDGQLAFGLGLYQRPTDPWESDPIFGTPALKPERSLHLSMGYEHTLPMGFELETSIFHKWLDRIVGNGVTSFFDQNAERYVNSGEGRVYGAEVLLRFNPISSLSGWLAYSFSRSLRRDREGEMERPFDFDQPHNLTFVTSWKATTGWIFGARIRLLSGNPDTPIVSSIYNADADVFVPVFGGNNSARLDAFFQIDLRADYIWTFETWKLNLYLDIQNATNRKNQEGWSYNYDFRERDVVSGLPLLPILGLKGEW
ncbi:MAG: TonB-dependent receptor [Myxococcota bacterium]|nr:TonB-dependent receptor [Myxococcota bacterium]